MAQVLHVLPHITLDTMPRMADYARVLAAVDRVTGLDCLAHYLTLGSELMADVVDDDPVAVAVRDLTTRRGGRWSGTAGDLYAAITPERPPKGWPPNPRTLAANVRAASTALRSVGIEITTDRTGKARTITCEMTGTASSSSSPGHPDRPDQGQRLGSGGDDAGPGGDDDDDGASPGDDAHPPIVTDLPPGEPPLLGRGDDDDDGEHTISLMFDEDEWTDDYGSLFDHQGPP